MIKVFKMAWPRFANWSLALLIFTSLLSQVNSQAEYRVNVAIKDTTGSDIMAHCASAEDDIGMHILHNNQILEWHFEPSMSLTTLFWCHFTWKTGSQTLDARFIVWDWDIAPVYDLTNDGWKVAQDGFWLYEPWNIRWAHHHNWGFHEAKLEGLPMVDLSNNSTRDFGARVVQDTERI